MDWYHLPLPIMNGYFKQVTPPKAISDSESGEFLLNKLTEFKKNGCRIFVIEQAKRGFAAGAVLFNLGGNGAFGKKRV
jgi:hypothetical protein